MFHPLYRPSERVEPGALGIHPSHGTPTPVPLLQAGSISLHPLFFILSFREGRRNIGEKHPAQREARGWRRCYIPPPIDIQSVGEGPEKWPPRAKWYPHPTCLANLHTTITHSTGGTGAPTRRRLSTIFPNTHPPTPTSRPLDWHPRLPLPPTPLAVNDRTDHTCVLHWI